MHLLVISSLPFLPSFNPSAQRRRREGSSGGIMGGGRQELQCSGNRVRIQLFIRLFLLCICSWSDLRSFFLPSIHAHSVDEQRGAAGNSGRRTARTTMPRESGENLIIHILIFIMNLLFIWSLPFLPSFDPAGGEARILACVFLCMNWVVIDSFAWVISGGGVFCSRE